MINNLQYLGIDIEAKNLISIPTYFQGGAAGMREMARCNELLQRVLREEELGHQFLESRGDEQLASVSRRRLGAEGMESSSSEYSRDDITGEEGEHLRQGLQLLLL